MAMAMARWARGRTKLAAVLGLLKDHAAAGLARASGPFSSLQVAVVVATNHHESLPDEEAVAEIIAAGDGSRMQASLCARLLVKRLTKTQSWCVAVKCLVVLHRSVLDGGFLYQDLLAYNCLRHGGDYLDFARFRRETASELCVWARSYGRYLDERLRCSHVLKAHLDSGWSGEVTQSRVEFMDTEQLLHQIEALQSLLRELCRCDPGDHAGQHAVIQGSLVLLVMDSFKVVDEIRFRIREMAERVANLALSQSLAVLHSCKLADSQMRTLESFLGNCKAVPLLSDIPLPGTAMVSKLDIQQLTGTIQSLQRDPIAPSVVTRSASTRCVSLRNPSRNCGPGNLQRTSSQPMRQLPRRSHGPNGALGREFPDVPEDMACTRHSSADLIDLSFDAELSSHGDGNKPPSTFRDLITF